MQTERMTVAQAIVRFLSVQYTQRDNVEQRLFAGMFGIFGHGNVTGLGQALEEVGQDFRYYRPQNEQAMVHTAAAYAKMKNRLSTFACTSSVGPGATNMITGAATATVNRIPVLLLPGDTFATRLPHPVLQQLENPASMDISVNDAFRPVSRFFDRVNRPEQLLASLPEAMRVLTDQAETGAVTLALPQDVQTEAYDFPSNLFEKRTHRIPRYLAPDSELSLAADLIRTAQKPVIVAGGGAIYSEASNELSDFCTRHGIPVVETQAGKGVLPWDHEWNAGPLGSNGGLAANRLAAQADVVIAIGTRLSDFTTMSRSVFQNPDARFVGINVSAFDAAKAGAFMLVGDAKVTIRALSHRLSATGYKTWAEYGSTVQALKADWNDAVDEQRQITRPDQLTQANVIGAVNEAAAPNDVVVCAAGGLPGDLLKLWRTSDPKGYHLEYGFSCMGYEIAGGLGAKMADPSREICVMCGDGSYLMLHTEIVTSIQEGYKITIVLLDNGGFQCIRGLQMGSGSPEFGNELRFRNPKTGLLDGDYVPIDFAKNAESLGARSLTANNESELRQALATAKTFDRTTLIYVPVQRDIRVPGFDSWWDVPIAEASDEAGVQTALSGYRENRKKQRFYY